MATTARLDLAVWRNDETYEFKLRVRGLDLSSAALRAQVRQAPDAPGAALVDLFQVQNANAEGVRLAGVAVEAGIPVSDVRICIDKATRAALPYAGELGDSIALTWVFTINGVTRLVGDFVVLAHALASDSAPTNRPAGAGLRSQPYPGASATLTIAQDQGATVSIDGVDQILPLLANAQTAVDAAVAAIANPRPASLSDAARNRVMLVEGGVYQNPGVDRTGAIKIRLGPNVDPRPTTLRVLVYDQYRELIFSISGNNQVGGWTEARARIEGQSSIAASYPVRFGHDGVSDCIWIGEVDHASWTNLAVVVLDGTFTGGTITDAWYLGWQISLETSFDTVTAGPVATFLPVTTQNIKFDTDRLAMAIGPFTSTGAAESNYNVVAGAYAGAGLTSGFNNTFVGMEAGKSVTIGSANVALGTQALPTGTNVVQNVAINVHALLSLKEGIGNVAIGAGAMQRGENISASIAVGSYAGEYNSGVRCIFIGDRAGRLKTAGDDKLFIGNIDDTIALIQGDMAQREAWVNGFFTAERFFVKDLNAAPASATAPGRKGEIRYTADFIYVCTAQNTWRRTPLGAW